MENKADLTQFDEVMKIVEAKCNKQEIEVLRQDLATKVHKHDLDILNVHM